MKVAVVLSGLAASVSAVSVGTNLPLPLGEVGWSGNVTPGGPVLEYWGADFEDIEAKIQQDYPGFSIYSDEEVMTTSATGDDPAVEARAILEARNVCITPGVAVTVTPASYGRANPFEINPGISALRRINAGCKARARTCIRNQCKNGSAIGMCNDNHHEINIPCPDIANMAENIKNHCYMQDTVCKAPRACDDTNIRTHGQIFSAHKTWNVIVGSCGFFGNGQRPVRA